MTASIVFLDAFSLAKQPLDHFAHTMSFCSMHIQYSDSPTAGILMMNSHIVVCAAGGNYFQPFLLSGVLWHKKKN